MEKREINHSMWWNFQRMYVWKLCIYVYVYVHIYIWMCAGVRFIYSHIHEQVHTYRHKDTYMHIYTCEYTHKHTYIVMKHLTSLCQQKIICRTRVPLLEDYNGAELFQLSQIPWRHSTAFLICLWSWQYDTIYCGDNCTEVHHVELCGAPQVSNGKELLLFICVFTTYTTAGFLLLF
jgi:hypothetical protein